MNRVSEVIKVEDIRTWNKATPIIIKAGTGVGKSYFIKNNLYAFAKANDKRILMLIHRSNCVEQFKAEILRDCKQDVIDIRTYQSIDAKTGGYDFSAYEYIVCDEFHYFMSDSTYNTTTDVSFDAIMSQTDAQVIMMSATGDWVTKYINGHLKMCTVNYELPSKYDFIDCMKVYHKDSTVETLIEEAITRGDKAIFFFSSAKTCYQMYEKYKEHSTFNVSKSNVLYKHVTKDDISRLLINEKFDSQLLFTTTCMDAGLNIVDEDVKHIIIDGVIDFGVIKQCLGRKRMQHVDDKVTIYVKNVNGRRLGGIETELKSNYKRGEFFMNNSVEEYVKLYSRKPVPMVFYHINENGDMELKLNKLSCFKHLIDITRIEHIKNHGDFGFVKLLADELQQESYTVIEEVEKSNRLTDYLDALVGVELRINARVALIDTIDLRDARNRQQKSIGLLNMYLSDNGFPYTITSKRVPLGVKLETVWVVGKVIFEQLDIA